MDRIPAKVAGNVIAKIKTIFFRNELVINSENLIIKMANKNVAKYIFIFYLRRYLACNQISSVLSTNQVEVSGQFPSSHHPKQT